MTFTCTIQHLAAGQWRARCAAPTVGTLVVTAPGREEVLAKLRGEIRYRMELCPCSGVSEGSIDLDVRSAPLTLGGGG